MTSRTTMTMTASARKKRKTIDQDEPAQDGYDSTKAPVSYAQTLTLVGFVD